MCGIIYSKRLDNKLANKLILKRYEKQKTRGTQGFGFIEIKNGVIEDNLRSEGEEDIKEMLRSSNCDEILFHHRFPTSTPNFIESTHPIKISNKLLQYDYYVVHNGIISNDTELKKEHNELGFVYTTEIKKNYVTSGNTYTELMWNDSESMAIDFCLALEKGQKMKSKGSIAFIAIQYEKKTNKALNLLYGRNLGNPLKQELSKEMFCLSSESGEMVEVNKLYCYDYSNNTISSIDMDIGKYEYAFRGYDTSYNKTSYNNYDYDDLDDNYDKKPSSKESKEIVIWDSKGNKLKNDSEGIDIFWERFESITTDIELTKEDIKKAQQESNYDLEEGLKEELGELEDELKSIYDIEGSIYD